MEKSLKEMLPTSKTDQDNWEKFKQQMIHKVNQSLVAQKTLISTEQPHVPDILSPHMIFELPHQVRDLLIDESFNEHCKSFDVSQGINDCMLLRTPPLLTESPKMLVVDKSQCQLDNGQFEPDDLQNSLK